jgi:hypothetical protein
MKVVLTSDVTDLETVLALRKQLTEAGLDAGADTIGWHLQHHHRVTVSRARPRSGLPTHRKTTRTHP